jgi:hypothetical protein
MRRVDVSFALHAPPETPQQRQLWRTDPPLRDGDEVIIAPGIKMSRLTDELRRQLDLATQERGFNFGAGMRSVTYGIVRDNAPGSSWDEDGTIRRLLGLSRVVHPSTLGDEVAGTLYFDDTGELECIAARAGDGAYGCRSLRPWLTKEDCEELGRLFQAYEALPVVHPITDAEPRPTRRLPLRLHRALWNLAYAAFVRPAHIRWLIVATALEGVIETGGGARQEFMQRLLAIGPEVGVAVTKKQIDQIYSLRSTVAHRGWFSGKEDAELDASYVPMDRLVAGIVRQAIIDAQFRSAFDSAETIATRWPVAIASNCSCGAHRTSG